VNVGDLANLLTGVAAIITSLTGSGALVWAITRGSPRERRIAARTAMERTLDPPLDDDGELPDALKRLAEELRRQREEEDE
jgi:hypothetical protein